MIDSRRQARAATVVAMAGPANAGLDDLPLGPERRRRQQQRRPTRLAAAAATIAGVGGSDTRQGGDIATVVAPASAAMNGGRYF